MRTVRGNAGASALTTVSDSSAVTIVDGTDGDGDDRIDGDSTADASSGSVVTVTISASETIVQPT